MSSILSLTQKVNKIENEKERNEYRKICYRMPRERVLNEMNSFDR